MDLILQSISLKSGHVPMSQVRADQPKPRDGTVGEVRCHRFAWLGNPPGKMVFFRTCSWEEHGNSRVSSWGFQGEHGNPLEMKL